MYHSLAQIMAIAVAAILFILGTQALPTGLQAFHEEHTLSSARLASRIPPIRIPPGVAGKPVGGAGGAHPIDIPGGGTGGVIGGGERPPPVGAGGPSRPNWGPAELRDPGANGYSIGLDPDPDMLHADKPGIRMIYQVTHPEFEGGTGALDIIGVGAVDSENANHLVIFEAANIEDTSAQRMGMSELAMNVWKKGTGGRSPTEIQRVTAADMMEDGTLPVVQELRSLFGSRNFVIDSTETDVDKLAGFTKLTTKAPGGAGSGQPAWGASIETMNAGWIGKNVGRVEVKDGDLTYHLI